MTRVLAPAAPAPIVIAASPISVELTRRAAWTNLLAASMAMLATMPSRVYGLGVITEPLLRDFGLSRVEFGNLNLWATLATAVFCVPCGWIIDRCGTWRTQVVVVVLLGATTLWMSRAATVAILFVTITLCRMLGQGILALLSTSLVGKSFPRRIGMVMSVYSILYALGYSLLIKAIALAMKYGDADWRAVWSGIGWGLLVGMLPLSLFLIREPPVGIHEKEETRTDEEHVTLRAALRTPAFWMFCLASLVCGVAASGIGLFNESVFKDRGFDRDVFLDTLAWGTILVVLFNPLNGWLGDRWSMGRLQAVAQFLIAVALATLPFLQTVTQVYIFTVLKSFAFSIYAVLYFAVWSYMFGRKNLAQIQGAVHIVTVLASGLGPVVYAYVKEATGSYVPVLFVLAAASAVLGVIFWWLPVPCARRDAAGANLQLKGASA